MEHWMARGMREGIHMRLQTYRARRVTRAGAALLLAALATGAFAQRELAGERNFPQARTLSGLPGGASGVLPDGTPDFNGAMAFSTPIGHTLGKWHIQANLGSTSKDKRWRGFDGGEGDNKSNGTGVLIVGVPTELGEISVSYVQTSRLSNDRIWNFQMTPKGQKGPVRFAIGVQDAFDKTVTTPVYQETARSAYGVATYQVNKDTYVSAGIGTQRFRKGFVNASTLVTKNVKAVVEHDGYNWNYGVAFNMGSKNVGGDRRVQATSYLGFVRGKYATWTIGFSL